MDIPADEPYKELFMQLVNGVNDKHVPFHVPPRTPSKIKKYVSDYLKPHSVKRLGAMRANKRHPPGHRAYSVQYKALYGRNVPRVPMQQFGVMIQDTVTFCLQNPVHNDIPDILAAVPAAKTVCDLFAKSAVRGDNRSPIISQCALESTRLRTIIDYAWISRRDGRACINLFELKVSLNKITLPSKIYNAPTAFPTPSNIFLDEDNINEFWVVLALCQMSPGLRAAHSYISSNNINATVTAGVIYTVPGSAPKYFIFNNTTYAWVTSLETLLIP
jgi:hypothetical protein